MKKTIFLLATTIFICLQAKSQSANFGVKAGMTLSNMKSSQSGISINLGNKVGYYAGGFADIKTSGNFSVQPEAYYSFIGAKFKGSIIGQNLSVTEDLGYINIPVLLKYNDKNFSILIGPQIGFLLSAKEKLDSVKTQDVKDEFKSVDIAGIIGASYTLKNGFGLDARYQLGFANVGKGNGQSVKVKNNAFMAGIHYLLNRGK